MTRLLLTTALLAATFATANAAEEGFQPLFDGQFHGEWIGDVDGYPIENGAIVCRGKNLFTKKEYGDFVLRLEINIPPNGNNGVAIRSPIVPQPAYDGIEIQVIDNQGDRYNDPDHPKYLKLKSWQLHGAIYGVLAAKTGHLKPAGEWNQQEIRAEGSRITVTLNGTVILDADLEDFKKDQQVDGRPHPGLHAPKGHIGFAGHGDPVMFRNVRIKELD
jgi:hypothetical protein